jgi:hypothetical protein
MHRRIKEKLKKKTRTKQILNLYTIQREINNRTENAENNNLDEK